MRSMRSAIRKVGSSKSGFFAAMTTPPDDWPSKEHRIAPASHVLAVGQVALAYSFLEDAFRCLFLHYFPGERDFSERLFQELPNRKRIDLLRAIIKSAEGDAVIADHVLHAILCFEICNENRNFLMLVFHEGGEDAAIARLSKRASRDPRKDVILQVPLKRLRQIADETHDLFKFTFALYLHARDKNLPPRSMGRFGFGPSAPLPEKPLKPYRLSPTLPQEAR